MFDTISNRSNTSSIFEGLLGSASASSRASAAAKSLEARSFSEEMQETQAPEADVAAASTPETVLPTTGNLPTGNDQNSSRQDSATAQKSSPAAAAVATPAQAASSKTSAASAPAASGTAATDPTGNAPKTPIEILQDVMKAQGIDPGKYKMESFEEVVMYPGGSFMHRYTQVDLPNGYQEKFSTDLMAKFPEVTVNELSRIMKMGADGPVTGLV